MPLPTLRRLLQGFGLLAFSVSLSLAPQFAQAQGSASKEQQRKVQKSSKVKKAVVRKSARVAAPGVKTASLRAEPGRMSFGQMAGLHSVNDPLSLKSSVALVIDQDTREVLLSKNDHAVLPIASLTKLMTGFIVSGNHAQPG